MTKIIASALIAAGLLVSVGSAVNAADFNADSFFEQMTLNGK